MSHVSLLSFAGLILTKTIAVEPLYSGRHWAKLAVLYREVSPIQSYICTQLYVIGIADTVLIRKVLIFEVSFIERFLCTSCLLKVFLALPCLSMLIGSNWRVTACPSSAPAVPSPVLDVMVSVLPRVIDLFWSAPLYPNGELLAYIVIFNGEFTLNNVTEQFYDFVMFQVNVSDDSMISLSDLEPFSNYTITLSPLNSAGEGNVTELSVMTPEDG